MSLRRLAFRFRGVAYFTGLFTALTAVWVL